ncbi:MAG: hypothetical protein Q4B54_06015 [Coriobacteriales bacterium]|nr:hypothetical protein [Coriobacteriales bacterium]
MGEYGAATLDLHGLTSSELEGSTSSKTLSKALGLVAQGASARLASGIVGLTLVASKLSDDLKLH